MLQIGKIGFALLLFFSISCSGGDRDSADGKLVVLVSVAPQKYFLEQIAGDLVEVLVLIPPGASPATYEISSGDMRIVSEADIWFTIGLQSENNWIESFSSLNENLLIARTDEEIQRLPIGRYAIPGESSMDDDNHVHDHDHDHSGLDPHIWLSPALVKLQATAICETLVKEDPLNGETYSENLSRFLDQITELQHEIQEKMDPFSGEGFMVFHPAWGYFADEFSLLQVPIEISGNEPTLTELARLIDFGKSISVKIIFVSPQFSEASAATIAEELNADVVFIDPLAENWNENLLFVAGELVKALDF